MPRMYFWLSYDGRTFRLNIKNTSKIGTTIKIINCIELKELIGKMHESYKDPIKYPEYINKFEGEI
jgi:hypothetical protein